MFAQELIVEIAARDHVPRIARLLAVSDINIRAINLSECRNRRVVHLVVDDPDGASAVFTTQGFRFETSLILALRVGDTPGGLAAILDQFEEARIDIEYLYTSIALPGDGAVVLIRPEDLTLAQELVERRGIKFLNRL